MTIPINPTPAAAARLQEITAQQNARPRLTKDQQRQRHREILEGLATRHTPADPERPR